MARRSAGSGKARRGGGLPRRGGPARRWAIGWLAGGLVLVAAVVAAIAVGSGAPKPAGEAKEGAPAPEGTFVEADGARRTIASLRGQTTLLWFVSTWCSSCQAGTAAMAENLSRLTGKGVKVVELELYEDLGQPGPSIAEFARRYAGPAAANPNWRFGLASATLTHSYDPEAYLDIYYVIDPSGRITYSNSSPASTMGELLEHV